MAKKIHMTGKAGRRIEITGKPQRRIEPEKLAAELGAESVGEPHASGLDPVALAAVGSAVIERLRSTGGRPALADAAEICRVPLSTDDLAALKAITEGIERSTGKKPSVGQVVGVIVREFLTRRPAKRGRRARESEGDAPSQSFMALVPRLSEIASKISGVHQTAGAIEAAVKQMKKDMEKAK
jgi:hypothetical protein